MFDKQLAYTRWRNCISSYRRNYHNMKDQGNEFRLCQLLYKKYKEIS